MKSGASAEKALAAAEPDRTCACSPDWCQMLGEARDPAQVRIDDIAADRADAAQERHDRALGYVEDERGASC